MTLFAFTCFIAAVLQATCGFGYGIFAMSLFPHFLPVYSTSLVTSTLLSFGMCLFIVFYEYKHISWKMIFPTIIGNFAAITCVMMLWNGQADAVMKKTLGVFLICLSLYFIFLKSKINIKATFRNGFIAGVLGGVCNALFSMGGPPVVVYMLAAAKDNKEYMASLQLYFCFSGIYVSLARLMRGMVSWDVLSLLAVGIPMTAAGTWLGLRLFDKLNPDMLRFSIYVFMAASGALMLV